jgi:hypothetical protein
MQRIGSFFSQSPLVSALIDVQLLETFTKKNAYKYSTAENGLLALQAFQNTPDLYDIVFMGKQTCSLNCCGTLTKE